MRIAYGGINHESSSYATAWLGPTKLSSFGFGRGDELLSMKGTRTGIGGVLAGLEAGGHEGIPLLINGAESAGLIADDAHVAMRDELLDRIAKAMPFDALVLTNHGAAVAESCDDVDGDLLQRVRALLGPDVPIVVTLDLHTDLTPAMVESADVLLAVHHYPHIDHYERALEAVELVPQLVAKEIVPTPYMAKLPALLPMGTSFEPPVQTINEHCAEQETREGVVDCTFFHGFAFTDAVHAGMAVLATANNDPQLAKDAAMRVAQFVWDNREGLRHPTVTPEQAAAAGRAATKFPIVVSDSSDNPGAAAPGDSTHLLKALIDGGPEGSVFGVLFDPEAAAKAHAAGEGAEIDVELGGRYDPVAGDPVKARARVIKTTDGTYTNRGPMAGGTQGSFGPSARLKVGPVDVIVGTRRSQVLGPEIFEVHDIDVMTRPIVAVKSRHHFRSGFQDIAAEILACDSPGLSTYRVESLPRERIPRPMWPFDPETEWP